MRGGLPVPCPFQSQLGSIGASPSSTSAPGGAQLSIPAWFDWRSSLRGIGRTHPSNLSIPAWFDWRITSPTPGETSTTLSIPAWFDWRVETDGCPHIDGDPFNPSLVRLARCTAVGHGRGPYRFQSQLGSIGARGQRGSGTGACPAFNPSLVRLAPGGSRSFEASPTSLSIPAWFDWRRVWWALVQLQAALSIPAWFDWRARLRFNDMDWEELSIPAWFDWRPDDFFDPRCRAVLSIPAWFDWRSFSCHL